MQILECKGVTGNCCSKNLQQDQTPRCRLYWDCALNGMINLQIASGRLEIKSGEKPKIARGSNCRVTSRMRAKFNRRSTLRIQPSFLCSLCALSSAAILFTGRNFRVVDKNEAAVCFWSRLAPEVLGCVSFALYRPASIMASTAAFITPAF